MISARLRMVTAGLACLGLAGCDLPKRAPAPPEPALVAPPLPAAPPPTARSAAAMRYFAQVQETLLAQGMMRTDGGGDVPYSDRMLADNFMQIALFTEYRRGAGGPVRQETQGRLRRWEVPVRIGLRFGSSVPPERQATDRARVASFVARLARVTGHPMAVTEANPNFLIYFVSEDERKALGPAVRAILPTLGQAEVAGVTDLPKSTYCLVYAQADPATGAYIRALAVIRTEHPDLLRLSCIHEEIAQALGLPNDSPRARPSIFNDDEEFALLTDHDEQMLRILYSPDLRPGMTAEEARPVVRMLAARMMAGES